MRLSLALVAPIPCLQPARGPDARDRVGLARLRGRAGALDRRHAANRNGDPRGTDRGRYDTSNNIVRTFLDGRGVSSGVWTGPQPVFIGLKIGINRGGSQRYLGIIDDVHVFARTLSLSEIAAIFDAGANGICP